jgi:hypothetical protein
MLLCGRDPQNVSSPAPTALESSGWLRLQLALSGHRCASEAEPRSK